MTGNENINLKSAADFHMNHTVLFQ